MQLLTYTDYALRVLIYVGASSDPPVPTPAIARAYGVSIDHVVKAAKALTRFGLLRATRGVGGGVSLAKTPEQIRLGAVVRLFEDGRGPVECHRAGPTNCRIEAACLLRLAFARAESAFYRELDEYTLADLLKNRAQVVRLLDGTLLARRPSMTSRPTG